MTPHKQPLWSRSVAAALAMSMGVDVTGCSSADAEAVIAEARQARDRGDQRAAISQLRQLLAGELRSARAHLLLGELYLDQGDLPAAQNALREAFHLDPAAGSAPTLLGAVLIMLGRFEQLLAELDTRGPSAQRPAILALHGHALLGLHNLDDALAMFQQAMLINADCPEALLGMARLAWWRNERCGARAWLKRALAASPGDAAVVRFHADLLRADGELAQAELAHQGLLERRPHQAQVLVDLAQLHTAAGAVDASRDALAQARKLAGASVLVLYAEALLRHREGNRAQASEIARRVLRAAPEHAPALLLAGALALAQNEHGEADVHLQKFLRLVPAHPYATRLMASLQMESGHPESALAMLAPLLADESAPLELLTLAAQAALQASDYSRAAGLFERASVAAPTPCPPVRALALSRMGEHDQLRLIADLERLLSRDEAGVRPALLSAMIYARNQQPDQAYALVDGLEQHDNSPLVQHLKGQLQLGRQDSRSARISFAAALALDAAFLPALQSLELLDSAEGRPLETTRNRYLTALAASSGNSDIMEALSRLAQARQHPAEAISWMERACAENPGALPLAVRACQLYLQLGEPARALDFAARLQASHGEQPDLVSLLGQSCLALHDHVRASDAFLRLAVLTPDAGTPHLQLAWVYEAMQDDAAALTSLKRALSIEPDLAPARAALVQLLLRHQRYSEALGTALAGQHRQPKGAAAYALEGDVHGAQRQHEAAARAYQLAFAMEPSSSVLVLLFNSLLACSRQADAHLAMTAWLTQHPDDVPARHHFASARLAAGDYAGAATELEQVLEHAPDKLDALNDLAWTYQRLGNAKALALAQRAHALAPDNAAIMDTLGWIHLEQGEFARALPLLQQASALAPLAGEIQFHLGTLLAQTGERDSARRALEKALASTAPFAGRNDARTMLSLL